MNKITPIPIDKSLSELGLDEFNQSPLKFFGSEVNIKAQTMYEAGVPSNFIQDGDTIVRLNIIDGWLQSNNFVTGVSGWRIDSDGNAEFGSGYFRGDITGSNGAFSGTISAAGITAGTISSKLITLAIEAGTGDTAIKAGKTDFTNTETGFILGLDDSDSDKPKFYIGSDTKYLNWDGSDLTIRGTLNADDITAGTLVGRTVKAKGSGTGVDVWLDSSDGAVKFYNGASLVAYIFSDTNGHITIDSDNHIYISADGSGDDIYFVAGDDFAVSSRSISIDCSTDIYHICDNHYVVYNDDGDNSDCHWVSDTTERMQLQQDGDLIVDGNLSANNFDFAEYFESKSGEKIPNGTTVVLEGEKIRPALPGETPIGVISATAGVALNGGGSEAGNSWGQKYLRDDFGEKVYEEVERWSKYVTEEVVKENGKNGKRRKRLKGFTVETKPPKGAKVKIVKRQKLNPFWNPNKTFIPRKERQEWNIVGLLGRVRIRVGQPVSPSWIKLRTISDIAEEWLIK